MAQLLEINPYNPQERLISIVVDMLRKGAVICYPTDTTYGIGCDIFQQKAVNRVYRIKQRPKQKPFSFMCSSLKNISNYGHVGNTAYRLMRKKLPGPYTFVLPGTKLVPKIMLTKQKTVGIRVPDHPICLTMLNLLANPVLNTSATLEKSSNQVIDGFDLINEYGNLVDLIIDGGPVYSNPSTVVSLVDDHPEILRHGKGEIDLFI